MESHRGSILIRASIEDIAKALTEVAIEAKTDVVDSEIESIGCFALVYQISGQIWSSMLQDWDYTSQQSDSCRMPDAAQLSQLLNVPVINFSVSDTSSFIGYELFEAGRRVEYFAGSEEGVRENWADENSQVYEWVPYKDEPELVQSAVFWSEKRRLTADDIENIWRFPDRFLRENDAYEAGMDISYFLNGQFPTKGQRYRVSNQGTTHVIDANKRVTVFPELVRVDYFRFGH